MCLTLCDPMDCSIPRFPVCHYLPEFAQTHVHWVSDVIQLSHPLSSSSPPAFNLSQHQGLFQWVSSASGGQSIGASASASVLPVNIQGGSPCFQGPLKRLLQHHSSKASILWRSVFFMVQIKHLCTTTGKTIALTIWTFVGKVMSLLFNILSEFVIALLARSKRLLISWQQSPSTVILELQSSHLLIFIIPVIPASTTRSSFRPASMPFQCVLPSPGLRLTAR